MNKAIFTVMLMLSFSLTGCIEDEATDLQPEPVIEPTGASDLDSLERRINELENQTEELRYDNDKLGNRIVDLEADNSALMNSYQQLLRDHENLTVEINSLIEELEELENSGSDNSELLAEIATLEQKIAELEEDVEELMFDKSLLYNKLHLLRDINTDEIVFAGDVCISGCSAYTRDIFDMQNYYTESDIGVYGENIFFGASSTGYGYNRQASSVWISDGTPFGTYKLSDFSDPSDFITVDRGVFFIANDGNYGYEIAFSDGTPDGTVRVTDDGHNCTIPNYDIYGVSENAIFFSRDIYTNDCSGGYDGEKLYRVTALNNGEFEIVDLDVDNLYKIQYDNHIISDGKLFFVSRDYDEDTLGLYFAGSQNITLIAEYDDNQRFGQFGAIAGSLYFGFGEMGNESLWKSDGTEEGTFRLKSFHNNSDDRVYITEIYIDNVHDLIYFKATVIRDDGRSVNIYISDGTSEGTYSVIEGTDGDSYQFFQDEVDGSVYFVAERDSNYGDDFHFYVFDESTLSFDFLFNETENNIGGDLDFYKSILVRGDIYLDGTHYQTGYELWKIDINSEYIGLLHDVNPGPNRSGLDGLTYNNGKLYFSAFSATYGGEYWYITV